MLGVRNFIYLFRENRDWKRIAKTKAKELGVPVEEVEKGWEDHKELGIRIHDQLQTTAEGAENVVSYRRKFKRDKEGQPRIDPFTIDNHLENSTTYLEKPISSRKQGIWGFPDRIDVINNTIHIQDYKTWETIRRSSTVKIGMKVIRYAMFEPIQHIHDCTWWEATLQLSLYMYILWENNRHLKVGTLSIRHVVTNNDGRIIREDLYEVPYLRDEVRAMLKYKKQHQL